MASAESADTVAVRRVAERERLADERELLADERELLADERELLADERELLADERDRLARTGVPVVAQGASGSRLRVLESQQGIAQAWLALDRSRAVLARFQLAQGNEENAARQEQLAIAREMLASRVAGAQQAHAEAP